MIFIGHYLVEPRIAQELISAGVLPPLLRILKSGEQAAGAVVIIVGRLAVDPASASAIRAAGALPLLTAYSGASHEVRVRTAARQAIEEINGAGASKLRNAAFEEPSRAEADRVARELIAEEEEEQAARNKKDKKKKKPKAADPPTAALSSSS